MSGTADWVGPASSPHPGTAPSRVLRRMLGMPSAVIGAGMTSLLVSVALLAPALAPRNPFAVTGPALAAPSTAHPMGTDSLGRDVLSGVIFGARTSLTLALGVAVIVLLLGMTVGTVAGYRGGWVDDALMRGTEALQVLPRFFLALVVIALFGPGQDRLVLVLGLTSWPLLARVVRSQTLSLRQREFVQSAQLQGASVTRVVVREIWPNVLPNALTLIGLLTAEVMLIEASLGFLGLSDPNAMSWGYLASEAQRFLRAAWWLSAFPGLAILAAVLAVNLLADSLGDALAGRGGRTPRGRSAR